MLKQILKLSSIAILSSILFGCSGGGSSSSVSPTPTPSPKNMSKFTIVGALGSIAQLNSENKLSSIQFPNDEISSLAFGNGVYVASGLDGLALRSTDGSTWVPGYTGINMPPDNSSYVSYANNRFFYLSIYATTITSSPYISQIATSLDGVTWTVESSPVDGAKSVVYGNGIYVVIAGPGHGALGTFSRSLDGLNWSQESQISGFNSSSITSIIFTNNQFIATGTGGEVATSADAVTWTLVNTHRNNLNSIVYAQNKYVAVADGGAIIVSQDGVTWESQNSNTSLNLNSITFNESTNEFIAVGDKATIITSTDAINWESIPSNVPESIDLSTVSIINNTVYITGGSSSNFNGYIASSKDLITWTASVSSSGNMYFDVVYGNKKYVAVGLDGNVDSSYLISTSLDGGITWTSQDLFESAYNGTLYGVTYGNGTYVAVGDGVIFTSTDAESWIENNVGPQLNQTSLFRVAYLNGKFFATNQDAEILSSDDATTWTHESTPITGQNIALGGLAYGNGKYIAVGGNVNTYESGYILSSNDGVTWNIAESNTYLLSGVSYAESQFVAVGTHGTILTSPDGNNWTAESAGIAADLSDISYGNGQYVAVGIFGNQFGQDAITGAVMLTSPDGITWNTIESSIISGAGYTGITFAESSSN